MSGTKLDECLRSHVVIKCGSAEWKMWKVAAEWWVKCVMTKNAVCQ